jgi:hemolysin activation/secretion protein
MQSVPAPLAEDPAAGYWVSSINLTVKGDYDDAPSRPDWTAAGTTLRHRAGMALDSHWVCMQFEDMVGRAVPSDAVVNKIQQINLAYVANGYLNSGVRLTAEPQGDSSSLELELIFGHVMSPVDASRPLRVTWPKDDQGRAQSSGLGENFIRDRLPSLDRQPFNAIAMESEFRSLAENQAIQRIEGGLSPGARPGEAYVDFLVTPQPQLDFHLSVANSRSPSVGGERVGIGGSFRNSLFDGDVFAAEYGQTKGLYDAYVAYQTPFLHPRLMLDVRGEVNQADVVDPALQSLDIRSESQTFEAGLQARLIQRPILPKENGGGFESARTVSIGARVARKESQTFLLGLPFSFSPGSVGGRAETTVAKLSADWVERSEQSVYVASVTVSQGLEGSGTDVVGAIVPDENFTSAALQVSHARALPFDFQLNLRVAGQVASGTLYSSERFSVGGESTVRGYRENLLLADSGAMARVELSHPLNLGGDPDPSAFNWGAFRLGVFGDYATTRNEEGPNPRPAIISSAGLNLEWAPSAAIRANLVYGHAFKEVVNSSQRDLQDDGVHFKIEIRPLEFFKKT